jgi:ATP-dependent DNA helicase RecG
VAGEEGTAMPANVEELMAALLLAGGDTSRIEVKAAAGGLPESVTSTLSALANLPGGGFLILGLDEAAGFRPVGLDNPNALKKALGSRARALTPPARLDITDALVEGRQVVITEVAECDIADKPCRVTSTGKAYQRSHDGDYELSALEVQGYLAGRRAPRADRQPVPGSSAADLDPDLVAAWTASLATRGRAGLRRYLDDQPELLRRAGVTTSEGELTLAGLLALGLYPQQYFPRMVIQAAVVTGRAGERARNAQVIDGPIPAMLEATMEWLAANTGTTIQASPGGHLRDVPDYPPLALRELVANALVHRDLSAWAEGQAIEIRLTSTGLVIANPGGLYGITADRLGREHVTSARNQALVGICQDVHTVPGGQRIVEALATGLPVVTAELAAAGLPPARYFDAGIRFTVMLSRPGPATPADTAGTNGAAGRPRRGTRMASVLETIRLHPGLTVAGIATTTGLPSAQVRRAVTELRTRGLVMSDAGPGNPGRYQPAQP